MTKSIIANVMISAYSILNVTRMEFLALPDIQYWDKISSVCSILSLSIIFFRRLTLFTLRLGIFNMGLLVIQAVKELFLNPNDDLPSDWVLMAPVILLALCIHHFPNVVSSLEKTKHHVTGKRLDRKGWKGS